jgi:hypothetical protein
VKEQERQDTILAFSTDDRRLHVQHCNMDMLMHTVTSPDALATSHHRAHRTIPLHFGLHTLTLPILSSPFFELVRVSFFWPSERSLDVERFSLFIDIVIAELVLEASWPARLVRCFGPRPSSCHFCAFVAICSA